MKQGKRLLSAVLVAVLLCLSACGQAGMGTADAEKNTPTLETNTSTLPKSVASPTVEGDTLEEMQPLKDTEKYDMTESPSNPELRTLSGKKINLVIGKQTFVVELYDNSAANDLLSRLPLTYTISDYAGWDEKLIRLGSDEGLSMEDYTGGDEPGIPEVGYYEPGNWIALYFGYIGYWSGKIPVGRINATCEEIGAIPAGSTVRIESTNN